MSVFTLASLPFTLNRKRGALKPSFSVPAGTEFQRTHKANIYKYFRELRSEKNIR